MTEATAPGLATLVVLISALLHAVANLLTKASQDALITRGCMNATALLVSLPALAFVETPGPELWPILCASVLVHGLYPFFLVEAYRRSDLSAAFPLARGSTPLFIALLSSLWLGELPQSTSLLGIALVSLAIASFAFEKTPGAKFSLASRAGAALATGLVVAIYTFIDAIGVRTAPNAATYIFWLLVLDGVFVFGAVSTARGRAIVPYVRKYWHGLACAGILGVLAYGLALYALRLGNVTEIAALREISVLFSAILGAVVLGETFGRRRIIAASIIVIGIGLMHLG